MSTFHKLSDEQIQAFHDDGYVIVPGLFNPEEIELLYKIAKADKEMSAGAADRLDASGAVSKLTLRNDLHDDLYSTIVRSRRVADNMETLLGDEVYHWHHKMMLKEPYVGGAWEWHQDYGYWYLNYCLYPDMGSCMIAVDRATKENGCLQVIKGSHKIGRIDHGKAGDQTGADMDRVNAALERLERVYAEMEPGDALFFHGNTLHRSDQNKSPNARWTLIGCYNTKHNDPWGPASHPAYSPLQRDEDERVLEVAKAEWEQLQQKV